MCLSIKSVFLSSEDITMAYQIKSLIDNTIENLNSALKHYADDRIEAYKKKTTLFNGDKQSKGLNLIGQFLDQAGRVDNQYGIYGMSGWLCLTNSPSIRDDTNVKLLRDNCAKELVNWVLTYNNKNYEEINQLENECDDLKNIKDLKVVIPKICHALIGLQNYYTSNAEQEKLRGMAIGILKERILSAQDSDKFWPFSVGFKLSIISDVDCLIVFTCYVINTLNQLNDVAMHDAIKKGSDFLIAKIGRDENNLDLLKLLYALNTLQETKKSHGKDYKIEIENTLRKLFERLRKKPESFINPINIDFSDRGKGRYIRLHSDSIILNSLSLISDDKLCYVYGTKIGQDILSNISATLKDGRFHRDTAEHRSAISTIVAFSKNIRDLYEKIENSGLKTIGALKSLPVKFKCSMKFGRRFGLDYELISLILSLIGIILMFAIIGYDKISKSNFLSGLTYAICFAFLGLCYRVIISFCYYKSK
jgi:hypothetical protein